MQNYQYKKYFKIEFKNWHNGYFCSKIFHKMVSLMINILDETINQKTVF